MWQVFRFASIKFQTIYKTFYAALPSNSMRIALRNSMAPITMLYEEKVINAPILDFFSWKRKYETLIQDGSQKEEKMI